MTELQGHEDRLEISADSGVFVRSRAEGSHGRSRVGGSAVQHPHSARSGVLPIAPMGSPPSAAQTTPWPRPGRGRVLWPEARSSESAVPRSHPCTTGTAAPEPKRSDDPPLAPWFVSPTHSASAYPCSRSRRIPERLRERRYVGGVGVHLVAGPCLARLAMPAPVAGDDAVAVVQEEEHLRVPVVRAQRQP